MARAGAERAGGEGGAPVVDGRSGMVEGVNGGALRGTSAPPLLMTPDGGTDAVEVTGREGTVSNMGPGAVLALACAVARVVGFADFSDLCADSADFSDLVAGFADLSALCASGLCVSALCAGFALLSGFLSGLGAG